MLSKLIRIGFVVGSVAVALPASAQVFKCKTLSGATAFQAMPCEGAATGERLTVKPASGYADQQVVPASLPGASSAARPLTEAQRIEAQIADSQRNRRRQDLQERIIPSARSALFGNRDGCKAIQANLAASRYAYTQNLYGKTHAAQMSSEMAASAAMCDTKDRELKEALDTLQKECALIACSP